MVTPPRRTARAACSVVAVCGALVGCGGGTSPTEPGRAPTPTQTLASAPTSTPSPAAPPSPTSAPPSPSPVPTPLSGALFGHVSTDSSAARRYLSDARGLRPLLGNDRRFADSDPIRHPDDPRRGAAGAAGNPDTRASLVSLRDPLHLQWQRHESEKSGAGWATGRERLRRAGSFASSRSATREGRPVSGSERRRRRPRPRRWRADRPRARGREPSSESASPEPTRPRRER